MARTYVLDTNVLLFHPKSLFVFEEHTIVIPMLVIEELDKFKSDADERGWSARTAIRYLDKLRQRGDLSAGVELEGGGVLKVLAESDDFDNARSGRSNDNVILSLASSLVVPDSDDKVVLVSRDTVMRIKGASMGMLVEDYRHTDVIVSMDDQYRGHRTERVHGGVIDDWYGSGDTRDLPQDLRPNECLLLTDGAQKSALIRTDPSGERLRRIPSKTSSFGVQPRNMEQVFALNLLLDPEVSLVTLSGQAGTGKTLLALAGALEQVTGGSLYRKILVARPVIPMGKGIGFLPGDLDAKLSPWMQPIFDNLEYLVGGTNERKDGAREDRNYNYLFDKGYISVEALTYIRGRSIPDQIMIIDEAQNLTPHEVKTILTRAGSGTKIILTGDPNQIDNPYVDGKSNGLTYVIERFKDHPLAGHVSLTKGERSDLAQAAADLL